MTTAMGTEPGSRGMLDKVAIGLVIVLCGGIFWYFTSQQQYALRNSALGFDGLRIWLSSDGHSAQSFTGGWPLDRDSVGLLIQPVFDTQLGEDRANAATKDELLLQPDEFDQSAPVIRDKSEAVKSLVVLPKWRRGLRLTRLAHPVLLAPPSQIQDTLHEIVGSNVGSVSILPTPFAEFEFKTDTETLAAEIYAAQVFEGVGCEPIVGDPGAVLLGLCPLRGDEQSKVYLLADPDLMNNHGLRLGDNARIAATLLPELAGEGRIIVDYSANNWLTEPEQIVKRERSWEDLSRLFGYPFTILWAGAALLLALAVWRGGLRNGPVDRWGERDRAGSRSANLVRARLMRLTDQDGALLADYVKARLQVQAAATLGPALAAGTSEEAYLRYVRTRAPQLAEKLESTLERIRALPAHLDATDAIEHVDQFELTLEQIVHDT